MLILSLGGAGYWYYATQSTSDASSYSSIRDRLSTFMVIPEDDPTVLEVSDAAELRGSNAFYQNVNNGDVVILWKTKAIIYRPSDKKIIEWGVILK